VVAGGEDAAGVSLVALMSTCASVLLAGAGLPDTRDNAPVQGLVPATRRGLGQPHGRTRARTARTADRVRSRSALRCPERIPSPLEADISQASSKGASSHLHETAQVIAYASGWLAEEAPVLAARERAVELGLPEVDPLVGSTLRFLATLVDARAVVEVGTGAGVSGLWLLSGMRSDGILTSVDVEAEHQRLARESFSEAKVPASRARLITGSALDVLPRLADGGYDLVFCHTRPGDYPAFLTEALRLLRKGGLAVFASVLAGGRVADSALRDADTVAMREFLGAARDDERLVPLLLPVGEGLLALRVR
jgi:predicted O-methyltransferase YrrM